MALAHDTQISHLSKAPLSGLFAKHAGYDPIFHQSPEHVSLETGGIKDVLDGTDLLSRHGSGFLGETCIYALVAEQSLCLDQPLRCGVNSAGHDAKRGGFFVLIISHCNAYYGVVDHLSLTVPEIDAPQATRMFWDEYF